jgi:D-ribose pyranose/furanose isomerase RbsD
MADKETSLTFNGLDFSEVIQELTQEEVAERVLLAEQIEKELADKEAKAAARTSALAKLAALGLTEEEIAAL